MRGCMLLLWALVLNATCCIAFLHHRGSHSPINARQDDRTFPKSFTRRSLSSNLFPRLPVSNISKADAAGARALVNAALKDSALYNQARVANPIRNTYNQIQTTTKKSRRQDDTPSFEITPEIAAAAAMVAESEARAAGASGVATASTLSLENSTTDAFWMESLERLNSSIDAKNGTSKVCPSTTNTGFQSLILCGDQVFRNVRDYGAVGDGLHVSLFSCLQLLGFPTCFVFTKFSRMIPRRSTRPLPMA